MPPLVLLGLKNSVMGEHSGELEAAMERAGPVLTVPSTPVVDTGTWYKVGMLLLPLVAEAQAYMCPPLPRNHWWSKPPR